MKLGLKPRNPGRRRRPTSLGLAFMFLAIGLVTTAHGWQPFIATDLGTLGGDSSYAFAIADNGTVVGESSTAGNSALHAFAWTPAQGMVDIANLGGSFINSSAFAVSDTGLVYGVAYNAADGTSHLFSWTARGGTLDLGTLDSHSYVTAQNDQGMAVGFRYVVEDPLVPEHAFVWTPADGLLDLGTLGGRDSEAWAVSKNGIVVGASSTLQNNVTHAFAWTKADGMVDLGAIGGDHAYSFAAAVNDMGIVVGTSATAATNAREHAFAWTQARGMIDLGALGGDSGWARAVSDNGLAAGLSYVKGSISHAFAWTDADGMIDLGTLGGTESDVSAVNGNGVVIGGSWTPGNVAWRAFVWTRGNGMTGLVPAAGFSGNSYASAITRDGFIAGSSCKPEPLGQVCHATLWSATDITAPVACPAQSPPGGSVGWNTSNATESGSCTVHVDPTANNQ